jgi:hypothetical protein
MNSEQLLGRIAKSRATDLKTEVRPNSQAISGILPTNRFARMLDEGSNGWFIREDSFHIGSFTWRKEARLPLAGEKGGVCDETNFQSCD